MISKTEFRNKIVKYYIFSYSYIMLVCNCSKWSGDWSCYLYIQLPKKNTLGSCSSCSI